MGKVDWKAAPDWADRAIRLMGGSVHFGDGIYFLNGAYGKVEHGAQAIEEDDSCTWLYYQDFELIEMRPDEWKKGAERMEPIVQNGNDGEHYAELDDYTKQPRYKGDDGLDHIDEFARDNSIEDFRAAMRFTIGKYEKRLGKKDAMSKELYKMSDYYKRWSEVEKKLEQEKGE